MPEKIMWVGNYKTEDGEQFTVVIREDRKSITLQGKVPDIEAIDIAEAKQESEWSKGWRDSSI